MTPTEIIDRASIGDVWQALGGPELRHARGIAWWRSGDGRNISVDEARGIWYDHSRGEGGGLLHLVQQVLGCDRRGALQWLADHVGVELDDHKRLSASERREYAERRRRAEAAAEEFADWREEYLDNLTRQRNVLWDSGRRACALGLRLLREGADDSPSWPFVWRHALDDLEGDAVDAELERIKALNPREFIAFRAEVEGRKAAAA